MFQSLSAGIRKLITIPAILAVSLFLQACPGGGGGAETGANGPVRYVSYSVSGSDTVSVSNTTTTTGTASATESSITVEAGAASVSFNAANGDTFSINNPAPGVQIVGVDSADGDKFGVAVNFTYSSFGAWLTGYNSGAGIAAVGSFGLPTAADSVPTSSIAYYYGASTGFYRDGGGNGYTTVSGVQIDVDFDRAYFFLRSTSTTGFNVITLAGSSIPALNLSGSGSISGAGLTGDLVSGNSMTGPVNGTFYGPSAQEAGGTWDLNGGGQKYIASFGAIRE